MPFSKAKNRERMVEWREKRKRSRLDVELKLTPEVADYLEAKAGTQSVEGYILAQLERAARSNT